MDLLYLGSILLHLWKSLLEFCMSEDCKEAKVPAANCLERKEIVFLNACYFSQQRCLLVHGKNANFFV